MRQHKEGTQMPVVTREEALRLLGIRKGTLVSLEHAAGIPHLNDRSGYTDKELKRLLAALKRILGH